MFFKHNYLVDTNILIDVLRNQSEIVESLKKLFEVGRGQVYITDVNVAEIYAGAHVHSLDRTENLLGKFHYLPITYQAAQQAGNYIYSLARQGIVLSLPDAFLAGLAKTENLILVTRNKKHFPMTDIEIISP